MIIDIVENGDNFVLFLSIVDVRGERAREGECVRPIISVRVSPSVGSSLRAAPV